MIKSFVPGAPEPFKPAERQHVSDAAWERFGFTNDVSREATERHYCRRGLMLVTVEEWDSCQGDFYDFGRSMFFKGKRWYREGSINLPAEQAIHERDHARADRDHFLDALEQANKRIAELEAQIAKTVHIGHPETGVYTFTVPASLPARGVMVELDRWTWIDPRSRALLTIASQDQRHGRLGGDKAR